jgi:cell division protein FtsL
MKAKKNAFASNRLRNQGTGVRIRNTRRKDRKLRLTTRQIGLISILFLIFMGSSIGYVWSNFEGTQIGYDLSRLQERERDLKELHRKLKLELAYLTSPQYLEEASREAGLRPADPEQVILLR